MGQVTFCPTAFESSLVPCPSCGTGWSPCQLAGRLGGGYGGCSPTGSNNRAIDNSVGNGACYYCPSGQTVGSIDTAAQTIVCNGVTYGVVPAGGSSPVPPSTTAPVVVSTPASIQVVEYVSTTDCSGALFSSTTFATGVCLPVNVGTGNASIFTLTGNIVTAQDFADKACKTAGGSQNFPLNTCGKLDNNIITLYAYAPNTLAPAPFTTTTGQVTQTEA